MILYYIIYIPPPRGWSWFPAPPPVGVGGVVVDSILIYDIVEYIVYMLVFARNST